MVSGRQKKNLLVGLDAESLESDSDGDVLVNTVVPKVDLALLRRDIRLRLQTTMSRASENESTTYTHPVQRVKLTMYTKPERCPLSDQSQQ